MAVVALGLVIYTSAAKFVDDVVYGALRMKETWQVAHELFLLYLREIDLDATRHLSMANVFRRGGQDTLLAEARRNAAAFFRTRGGTPQEGAPRNEKFNSKASGYCKDYNKGVPCSRLDSNGACIFNHACDQWVSDKGKNGVCGGLHSRCECDYDMSKKLKRPASQ